MPIAELAVLVMAASRLVNPGMRDTKLEGFIVCAAVFRTQTRIRLQCIEWFEFGKIVTQSGIKAIIRKSIYFART